MIVGVKVVILPTVALLAPQDLSDFDKASTVSRIAGGHGPL